MFYFDFGDYIFGLHIINQVENSIQRVREALRKLAPQLRESNKTITKETIQSLDLLTLVLNITSIKLSEDREKDMISFYGSQEISSSTNQHLKTGKSRPT